MFKSLEPPAVSVRIAIDGKQVAVPAGISVAAALLLSDCVPSRRSALTKSPRAPYCMMGVCFECLLEIDGTPNRQGCMVAVTEGMVVRRSTGTGAGS